MLNHLINRMENTDFSQKNLGRPGHIVQIDGTMMNFSCESHRGRASTNRVDPLCIVKFTNKITRVFATVIPDKSSSTLIPIICSHLSPK
ncbi:hypothetical protein COBT_001820, partial [Conglomerata obtusa]